MVGANHVGEFIRHYSPPSVCGNVVAIARNGSSRPMVGANHVGEFIRPVICGMSANLFAAIRPSVCGMSANLFAP
jgi:hypothetical protein